MTFKASVFFQIFGASDVLDWVLPYDDDTYNAFAALRSPLFAQYATAGAPRTKAALAATVLAPRNDGADALPPGRQWAMSPQMPNMAAMFNEGNISIVSDIGSLVAPTTKAIILADPVPGADIPPELLAHNHQQEWLQSLAIDGQSPTGIAGRINDLLIAKFNLDPSHAQLDRIAFSSSTFLTAANNGPFQLTGRGEALQLTEFAERGPSSLNRLVYADEYSLYLNLMSGPDGVNSTDDFFQPRCLREASLWQKKKDLFTIGSVFTAWVNEPIPAPNDMFVAPALDPADVGGGFANTIPSVLDMLARHASETPVAGGLNHLMIHVTGGYPSADSHNNQADSAPRSQRYLDNAIAAYYQGLVDLGLEDAVQTRIATEFGRTITPNSSGTDHAWATYHFYIGGPQLLANSGGKFIGGAPVAPVFDPTNPDDPAVPWIYNSRGYIIPRHSTEQAMANMGLHLGLTVDEMVNGIMTPQGLVPGAFPNLPNFIPDGGVLEDAVLPIV